MTAGNRTMWPTRDRKPRPGCAVDGCDAEQVERIWCVNHYLRWWRTGSPTGVIDPRTASTRGLVKRRSAG